MEFLGKLGIDIKLLIAQLINFGLLLWLLKKFLYNPIIKRIEKDEEKLKQAQLEGKKLEGEKSAFARQQKEELGKSHERVNHIIAEAEEIAEDIRKRARKEAEEEKQKTIKQIHSRLKEMENDKK